ncbi:MAG: cytochrome c oxidase assembly protein [Actinomycetota bacterium]|nr:cytochrome c oxidase assembly protein [Actinomycetota bacterium]
MIDRLSFAPHPVAAIICLIVVLLGPRLIRRIGRNLDLLEASSLLASPEISSDAFARVMTRRQAFQFRVAIFVAYLTFAWPIGDLALHYSLFAYLISNSLLAIVALPLLLVSLPKWLLNVLTRHRHVDRLLMVLTRPIISSAIFSAAFIASMVPAVVEVATSSDVAFIIERVVLLIAALLMWFTALNLLPGTRGLSPLGRVAYLFAQSLIPTFPALILIFTRRSIYPHFAVGAHLIGVNPVSDQLAAGGVVKVISIAIFWSMGGYILAKATDTNDEFSNLADSTWHDIEREIERDEYGR